MQIQQKLYIRPRTTRVTKTIWTSLIAGRRRTCSVRYEQRLKNWLRIFQQ